MSRHFDFKMASMLQVIVYKTVYALIKLSNEKEYRSQSAIFIGKEQSRSEAAHRKLNLLDM
jgi:hypothetical protein